MNNDINLLPQKNTRASIEEKKIFLGFRVVAILCIAFVAISAIVVFFLKSQSPLPKLKKDEAALLTNLSFVQPKNVKYKHLVSRIKNVSQVYDSRDNFHTKLDVISENLPETVDMGSLAMDRKTVTISLSSKSLVYVNLLLDNFISLVSTKTLFKNLTLNSITVEPSLYTFSLTGDLL